MKAAVRLLVRFIFWFALIILGASALLVAHAYVTGYDPAGASAMGTLAQRFLLSLAAAWIPAVLLAGLIALFSAVRSFEAPVAAILVLCITWTVLLLAGGFLLGGYPQDEAPRAVVITEGRIVRVDDLRLYSPSRDGLQLAPLVVHDATRTPGFSVRPQATIDPEQGTLLVPRDDRFPVDLSRTSNSYPSMVRTPVFLRGILDDLAALARLLALGSPPDLPRLLNLLALALFLLGSWTLVRLTRWPLFNAALSLAALRFAVWIVPAVHSGPLRDLLVAAFDSRALPFASAAVLAAVGVGLLAVLVFMAPLEQWRRELEHG